ncbi:MAG: hypothetical protein Q4F69_06570 [Bacteroidia bacterium]|nr:hypothetical protein [Bacteroidia bacterium]
MSNQEHIDNVINRSYYDWDVYYSKDEEKVTIRSLNEKKSTHTGVFKWWSCSERKYII